MDAIYRTTSINELIKLMGACDNSGWKITINLQHLKGSEKMKMGSFSCERMKSSGQLNSGNTRELWIQKPCITMLRPV